MSKPYFGIHKVPKNRVRGTAEYCIKSGQGRYYGINSVEDVIDEVLAEKRRLANEKAKIKRQEAKKKVADANKKIKEANVAEKMLIKQNKNLRKLNKKPKNLQLTILKLKKEEDLQLT